MHLCQNQSLASRWGCLVVSCPNIGPLRCDTGAPSIPWILQLVFAEHLLTVWQSAGACSSWSLLPEGHTIHKEVMSNQPAHRGHKHEENGSPALITEALGAELGPHQANGHRPQFHL